VRRPPEAAPSQMLAAVVAVPLAAVLVRVRGGHVAPLAGAVLAIMFNRTAGRCVPSHSTRP